MIGPSSRRVASSKPIEGSIELESLKDKVLRHLEGMGFSVNNGRLVAPNFEDKERLRKLHSEAVDFQRAKSAGALRTHEDLFLRKMARGETIDVQRIDPILVPVIDRRSFEGLLWRWCSLHWSVPVSAGYGRRLRFLVMDRGHANKVMGLIGLGDPVFALRARDNWLGWTAEQRRERLTNVMDAFVLGAVPPYSNLLGGKLVALLATSLEVRQAFELRYSHRQTLITQRDPNAQLALVTTSSALGRSSIYNRLTRPDGTLAFLPTGYTEGTGDFHLSGSIYDELAQLAAAANPQKASHAHARWKESGARNRREVIQRALHTLGLDGRQLRVHGVRRQVFLAPLMANVSDHLIKGVDAQWITSSVSEASSYWLKRWATPRAARADSWRDFQPSDWRLYKQ